MDSKSQLTSGTINILEDIWISIYTAWYLNQIVHIKKSHYLMNIYNFVNIIFVYINLNALINIY